MSAESDFTCFKCGLEWCAIPPTKCPACNFEPSVGQKVLVRGHSRKFRGKKGLVTFIEKSACVVNIEAIGERFFANWEVEAAP